MKNYTYSQIRKHIRLLEKDAEWGTLTIEVFSDDSAVYLIDVDDKKIAMFHNMEEFMACPSLDDATKNHPYSEY